MDFRAKEAEQLKVDLLQSRTAEKLAKDRLMEITKSNVYQVTFFKVGAHLGVSL